MAYFSSMMYDKDAGHRTFMDDVYECQMRIPGASWMESTRPWTNVVSYPGSVLLYSSVMFQNLI